jgi:hypothetical protein
MNTNQATTKRKKRRTLTPTLSLRERGNAIKDIAGCPINKRAISQKGFKN